MNLTDLLNTLGITTSQGWKSILSSFRVKVNWLGSQP